MKYCWYPKELPSLKLSKTRFTFATEKVSHTKDILLLTAGGVEKKIIIISLNIFNGTKFASRILYFFLVVIVRARESY